MVRFPRGCRGPRAWHVVREALGTWETLSPPPIYRLGVGQFNHKKAVTTGIKRRESDHLIVL
jgi:hypothetical protein